MNHNQHPAGLSAAALPTHDCFRVSSGYLSVFAAKAEEVERPHLRLRDHRGV